LDETDYSTIKPDKLLLYQKEKDEEFVKSEGLMSIPTNNFHIKASATKGKRSLETYLDIKSTRLKKG